MQGSNHLLLREKAEVGFPSQLYGTVLGWGLQQEYASAFPTHFDVGVSSFVSCMSPAASFWISFRGNCSRVSVQLVCLWEREDQDTPMSPCWSTLFTICCILFLMVYTIYPLFPPQFPLLPLPLTNSSLALLASLLFLKHSRHDPASGPL